MSFWDSPAWRTYETAYGDEPGTRSRLLASATWQTQIVDLTQPEAELWKGIRKSYKSKIHWAERQREIAITEDPIAVGMARAIHIEAAGRETRPMATWQLMADWLVEHSGLLVMAPKSFAYFLIHETWSYYGFAASLEPDVNAALIWTAMKELKSRGVRYLELGWCERVGDSAKERSVAFFKSGFGGRRVPCQELPNLLQAQMDPVQAPADVNQHDHSRERDQFHGADSTTKRSNINA